MQDHMKRQTSETYKYYLNLASATDESSLAKRPLPKCIQDPSYHRNRVSSFKHAVEYATGTMVDPYRTSGGACWFTHIVKQEMWDKSDTDIITEIEHGSGSLVFRYYEEVVGVSIHVVVIRDGNMESLVPRHKGKYVWSPPYPLHIVIFETYKTTYGKESCTYDVIVHQTHCTKSCATLLDNNDNVVSYLIHHKSEQSVPVNTVSENVPILSQVIDRNGKVSTLIINNNSPAQRRSETYYVSGDDSAISVNTYTRPMAVPVKHEPVCFVDSHTRKMNVTKSEMGIEPVDTSKRSTNDVLYFPNDASFVYYVDRSKSFSTP